MGNPDASRKPFHRRLLSHLFTIVVAYLLVLALVRMFESHLIFFPNYPGRLDGDWHPGGLNVEDVWLTRRPQGFLVSPGRQPSCAWAARYASMAKGNPRPRSDRPLQSGSRYSFSIRPGSI